MMQWMQPLLKQAPSASVILFVLITLRVVEQFSLITVSWKKVNSSDRIPIVSSAIQQVSTTVQRVPSAIQQVSTTVQLVPSAIQQVSTTVQLVPSAIQQVSTTVQLVPSAIQQVSTTFQPVPTAIQQVSTTFQPVPTAIQQVSTTIQPHKRISSTVTPQNWPKKRTSSTIRPQNWPKKRTASTVRPRNWPQKWIFSTVPLQKRPKKRTFSTVTPQNWPKKRTSSTVRPKNWPKKRTSSTVRPKNWPKKRTSSTVRPKNWPKKRTSSTVRHQKRTSSAVQPIQQFATTGKRLSDLKDFRYLINNDVCGTDPVRILLATLADPRRPEIRQTLRRALPNSVLGPLKVRRIFLLADASVAAADQINVASQELLEAENSEHHDLIQGNFLDTYRNLTYKSLMALDWATTYCPQAKIIMKTDDDTGFDIRRFANMKPLFNQTMLVAGYLKKKRPVVRNDTGPYAKWKVSKQEWLDDDYPPYASGGMYMLDMPLASRLLERSLHVPYFWIEDVFVTGILAVNQSVERISLNRQFDSTWLNNTCTLTLLRSQNFTVSERSSQTIYRNPRAVVMNLPDPQMLEKLFNLYEYCFRFGCKVLQCHNLIIPPHKSPHITSEHHPRNLTISHQIDVPTSQLKGSVAEHDIT